MSGVVLETVALRYVYPDGTVALEGLNIAISTGSRVALLGPNGAGKTTLFLLLIGLLRPTTGRIRFQGAELVYNRRSLARLRQRVGLVFQDPEAQIFAPTVWEEVAFGPANQGLNAETVAERVEKALAATDLLELRDKATQFLSYGEKKRLCLAGVLAMAPEVLLLDEPTAGLDPEQARRVMAILDEQYWAGRTLVLATHDVDLAYAWADKVFVLSRGSLARSGEAAEIFRDEALLRATSLCPPLVFTLYEALRGRGFVPSDAPVPRSPEELLGLLPGDSSKFEVK